MTCASFQRVIPYAYFYRECSDTYVAFKYMFLVVINCLESKYIITPFSLYDELLDTFVSPFTKMFFLNTYCAHCVLSALFTQLLNDPVFELP